LVLGLLKLGNKSIIPEATIGKGAYSWKGKMAQVKCDSFVKENDSIAQNELQRNILYLMDFKDTEGGTKVT
jgi:hypothetical protein